MSAPTEVPAATRPGATPARAPSRPAGGGERSPGSPDSNRGRNPFKETRVGKWVAGRVEAVKTGFKNQTEKVNAWIKDNVTNRADRANRAQQQDGQRGSGTDNTTTAEARANSTQLTKAEKVIFIRNFKNEINRAGVKGTEARQLARVADRLSETPTGRQQVDQILQIINEAARVKGGKLTPLLEGRLNAILNNNEVSAATQGINLKKIVESVAEHANMSSRVMRLAQADVNRTISDKLDALKRNLPVNLGKLVLAKIEKFITVHARNALDKLGITDLTGHPLVAIGIGLLLPTAIAAAAPFLIPFIPLIQAGWYGLLTSAGIARMSGKAELAINQAEMDTESGADQKKGKLLWNRENNIRRTGESGAQTHIHNISEFNNIYARCFDTEGKLLSTATPKDLLDLYAMYEAARKFEEQHTVDGTRTKAAWKFNANGDPAEVDRQRLELTKRGQKLQDLVDDGTIDAFKVPVAVSARKSQLDNQLSADNAVLRKWNVVRILAIRGSIGAGAFGWGAQFLEHVAASMSSGHSLLEAAGNSLHEVGWNPLQYSSFGHALSGAPHHAGVPERVAAAPAHTPAPVEFTTTASTMQVGNLEGTVAHINGHDFSLPQGFNYDPAHNTILDASGNIIGSQVEIDSSGILWAHDASGMFMVDPIHGLSEHFIIGADGKLSGDYLLSTETTKWDGVELGRVIAEPPTNSVPYIIDGQTFHLGGGIYFDHVNATLLDNNGHTLATDVYSDPGGHLNYTMPTGEQLSIVQAPPLIPDVPDANFPIPEVTVPSDLTNLESSIKGFDHWLPQGDGNFIAADANGHHLLESVNEQDGKMFGQVPWDPNSLGNGGEIQLNSSVLERLNPPFPDNASWENIPVAHLNPDFPITPITNGLDTVNMFHAGANYGDYIHLHQWNPTDHNYSDYYLKADLTNHTFSVYTTDLTNSVGTIPMSAHPDFAAYFGHNPENFSGDFSNSQTGFETLQSNIPADLPTTVNGQDIVYTQNIDLTHHLHQFGQPQHAEFGKPDYSQPATTPTAGGGGGGGGGAVPNVNTVANTAHITPPAGDPASTFGEPITHSGPYVSQSYGDLSRFAQQGGLSNFVAGNVEDLIKNGGSLSADLSHLFNTISQHGVSPDAHPFIRDLLGGNRAAEVIELAIAGRLLRNSQNPLINRLFGPAAVGMILGGPVGALLFGAVSKRGDLNDLRRTIVTGIGRLTGRGRATASDSLRLTTQEMRQIIGGVGRPGGFRRFGRANNITPNAINAARRTADNRAARIPRGRSDYSIEQRGIRAVNALMRNAAAAREIRAYSPDQLTALANMLVVRMRVPEVNRLAMRNTMLATFAADRYVNTGGTIGSGRLISAITAAAPGVGVYTIGDVLSNISLGQRGFDEVRSSVLSQEQKDVVAAMMGIRIAVAAAIATRVPGRALINGGDFPPARAAELTVGISRALDSSYVTATTAPTAEQITAFINNALNDTNGLNAPGVIVIETGLGTDARNTAARDGAIMFINQADPATVTGGLSAGQKAALRAGVAARLATTPAERANEAIAAAVLDPTATNNAAAVQAAQERVAEATRINARAAADETAARERLRIATNEQTAANTENNARAQAARDAQDRLNRATTTGERVRYRIEVVTTSQQAAAAAARLVRANNAVNDANTAVNRANTAAGVASGNLTAANQDLTNARLLPTTTFTPDDWAAVAKQLLQTGLSERDVERAMRANATTGSYGNIDPIVARMAQAMLEDLASANERWDRAWSLRAITSANTPVEISTAIVVAQKASGIGAAELRAKIEALNLSSATAEAVAREVARTITPPTTIAAARQAQWVAEMAFAAAGLKMTAGGVTSGEAELIARVANAVHAAIPNNPAGISYVTSVQNTAVPAALVNVFGGAALTLPQIEVIAEVMAGVSTGADQQAKAVDALWLIGAKNLSQPDMLAVIRRLNATAAISGIDSDQIDDALQDPLVGVKPTDVAVRAQARAEVAATDKESAAVEALTAVTGTPRVMATSVANVLIAIQQMGGLDINEARQALGNGPLRGWNRDQRLAAANAARQQAIALTGLSDIQIQEITLAAAGIVENGPGGFVGIITIDNAGSILQRLATSATTLDQKKALMEAISNINVDTTVTGQLAQAAIASSNLSLTYIPEVAAALGIPPSPVRVDDNVGRRIKNIAVNAFVASGWDPGGVNDPGTEIRNEVITAMQRGMTVTALPPEVLREIDRQISDARDDLT